MWRQTYCSNFINCLPVLKILLLLERAKHYLQNKYNILPPVKNIAVLQCETFKKCCSCSLDDKAVCSTIC